MIGAIKRRWKSKKAKVLHKGSELSSSSDSCPTSRGFVDGPEDFDKMIKPPSPRQVHPVLALDKGDSKLGQFHNFHHLLQQNNGNTGNSSYILQQPPPASPQTQSQLQTKKKSSTLPPNTDDSESDRDRDPCHFIRVNSGRIELVSKDSWKTDQFSSATGSGVAERFLNRHLKNDVRHSWCGSAVRKNSDSPSSQSKRLSEDQQNPSGFRTSNNNNNRIYPQEDLPVEGHHRIPLHHRNAVTSTTTATVSRQSSFGGSSRPPEPQEEEEKVEVEGGGLLSPLRERLAAIEQLTTSLQSWQTTEKSEYEKCVSDLASQVSRAVALQQMMKSEVEKLQQRVVDLENHNKAMATMIIPTLMKLHDSTLGLNDAPQLKSIEPAPSSSSPAPTLTSSVTYSRGTIDDDASYSSSGGRMTRSDIQVPEKSNMNTLCSSLSRSNSPLSTAPSSLATVDNPNNSGPERKSATHFIATVTTQSQSQLAPEPEVVPQIVNPPISTSTPITPTHKVMETSSPRSPVKAPRMSKMSQSQSQPQPQSKIIRNQTSSTTATTTAPSSLEMTTSASSTTSSTTTTSKPITTSRQSLSSGIPRMASPARGRTTTTTTTSSTTPKPQRKTQPNNDRSCSPQRTSRLPVRKTTFSTNVPSASTSQPSSSTSNNRHPAATSKSLPANSNFQRGVQNQNSKSKSTFGFASPKKSPPQSCGGSSTRNNGNGGISKVKTNLPECTSGSGSPVVSRPKIPVGMGMGIKGTGKDEGYSTMSSEALAEQDLSHSHNHVVTVNQNNSLEMEGEMTSQQKSGGTFSRKNSSRQNNQNPSIHKSNTFNTFRVETGSVTCDADDEEDIYKNSRTITTSPSKVLQNSSSCAASATSTPSKKRSSYKGRVTSTTRMLDGNIVKIVRGTPYSVKFGGGMGGEESVSDDGEDDEPSSSTILWEDSDDSDILFLPLEITEGEGEEGSSRSTLVPLPQSSGETSRSYYSSWGRTTTTASTTPTQNCSTLEKGSDGSIHSNSVGRRPYPLRRTKGEVTVDILLIGGGGNGDNGGGDGSDSNSNCKTNIHNNNDNHQETDEMEERAFIEKWMQLEEVRNNQIREGEEEGGDEQWAWDWDGVERTYTRVLRGIPRINLEDDILDDEEEDIDVDLILEKNALNESKIDSSTWTKKKTTPKENLEEAKTTPVLMVQEDGDQENRDIPEPDPQQCSELVITLDENGSVINPPPEEVGVEGNEEDDPPPVIEFTPEFYRLANYGSNLSFSDNDNNDNDSKNNPSSSPAHSGVRVSPKKKRISRRSHSNPHPPPQPQVDKVSQTDFSCSSLENMSSVSSELSAECRNCLEIIKKLVGQPGQEGGESADDENNGACNRNCNGNENSMRRKEPVVEMDCGSFATTWISVPKGLPSNEVDRILEILSSSESEGVLSPSK